MFHFRDEDSPMSERRQPPPVYSRLYNDSQQKQHPEDGNQSGHSSETTATAASISSSAGDISTLSPSTPQGTIAHGQLSLGNLMRGPQRPSGVSPSHRRFEFRQPPSTRPYPALVMANNDNNRRLPGKVSQVRGCGGAGLLQVAPYPRGGGDISDNDVDDNDKARYRNDGNGGGFNAAMQIKHTFRRIRRPKQWLPANSNKNNTIKELNNNDEDVSEVTKERRNLAEKSKSFIIEFLLGSSIHGFIYLAKMGLNFVERILWFVFICIALFSIISLSKRTWERFQTSPTVISMDRNKLVWNTSFPSLTVCPHKRIDELKVEEYMLLHSEKFESEEDKDDFRDFIVKLASLSYENIETLPLNKTFDIPSDKYLDILYELKWNFEPEISSGAAVQMYIYETLTEFGFCHSVNSLVARYNSLSYWKNNEWNLLDHGDRVTVHPLDGEIYAQIINLSTAYDVYFHGAGDVPNISKQRYTFPESDYTTVELIALEIYTAEAAKAFTTKQRKCRFQHEAEELLTVPIYSFGLCLAECRMFFTLRVCGCVPHFYRNKLRNGRVLPICGFEGITCITRIKRDIITLKSDRYKTNCNCLSNCDDSNFFVQSYRSRVWFLGANLQWGIIDYPKMQLRRDVLFSFADVLVYIGGLVGFFLGCSALSFTEIIYYFTARLIRRMFFN